ncbi:MAG: metal ABC transporter permease [Campylobacterota bacterium]|nr:metal ABC transporter permease [Campylobacterota bacterium]
MSDLLAYEFIQNAIIAGVLVSIAAGIIGSLIVVNRMVFLAGGIAHAAYGGIGLAIYFSFPIFLGTSIFATLAAIFMAFIALYQKERIDLFIGVIWAVGMAIGIILVDLTPGYSVDLMSYLFGSILAVNSEDIMFMEALLGVIIFVLIFWYKEILSVSYDPQFASLRGVHVKLFYILILILSALTIVIAIKVVGLILVIALLTIPIYIAERVSSTLYMMMFYSAIIATFFTLTGLWFSYQYDLTSGATIILVSSFFLLLFLIIEKRVSKAHIS